MFEGLHIELRVLKLVFPHEQLRVLARLGLFFPLLLLLLVPFVLVMGHADAVVLERLLVELVALVDHDLRTGLPCVLVVAGLLLVLDYLHVFGGVGGP